MATLASTQTDALEAKSEVTACSTVPSVRVTNCTESEVCS